MPSLSQVDAYPVPDLLVPRVAKEHGYSNDAAASLVREAKRMLFLSVVAGEAISPSALVDDAWHEMLMFTRFYQEFADFIGGFIHHDPTPGQPDGGRTYERTKQLYEIHFDDEPDSRWWP
ncbi:MAG TPA: hypothetical protein VMU11_02450 [Verrucomicrobiae bacterium]|nr:hypothetical protein [Verrucomicrobiae bacterium]